MRSPYNVLNVKNCIVMCKTGYIQKNELRYNYIINKGKENTSKIRIANRNAIYIERLKRYENPKNI